MLTDCWRLEEVVRAERNYPLSSGMCRENVRWINYPVGRVQSCRERGRKITARVRVERTPSVGIAVHGGVQAPGQVCGHVTRDELKRKEQGQRQSVFFVWEGGGGGGSGGMKQRQSGRDRCVPSPRTTIV